MCILKHMHTHHSQTYRHKLTDTSIQKLTYTHYHHTDIHTYYISYKHMYNHTHICIYTYTHIYTHKETSAAFTLATALMHFLFERSFEIVRVETA